MQGTPESTADLQTDNLNLQSRRISPRTYPDTDGHRPGDGNGTASPSLPSLIARTDRSFPHLLGPAVPAISASMTTAEFVEHKFIPEFVIHKRTAGRNHFKAILKHVLHPEQIARLLPSQPDKGRTKLACVPDWPYIDALPLRDVKSDSIRRLTSAALSRGYSVQTVTHMRNVIRSIFSHAIRTGYYLDRNPAASVTLPRIERKPNHSLTLEQMRSVLGTMVYPERELALLTVLTDMTIVEICGLQWKYANLLNSTRIVEQEAIPPNTLAVRKQTYRGVLANVIRSRKRFVPIPRLLAARLLDLKQRKQFTGPDDFVLVSRNGNPIHPGNMAARRLKGIGTSLHIPGLAWSVFYKTRVRLKSELGGNLYEQFDDVIPVPKWILSQVHAAPLRRSL